MSPIALAAFVAYLVFRPRIPWWGWCGIYVVLGLHLTFETSDPWWSRAVGALALVMVACLGEWERGGSR
jgi:hypothetical protein